MRAIRLSLLAKAHISEIFTHYEAASAGLGFQFEAALDQLFNTVRDLPEGFREIEPGIRLALMRRFPNFVYYTLEEDQIKVLAVLHTARERETWRRESNF